MHLPVLRQTKVDAIPDAMANDDKPESVDLEPKPMKGKYDGRRFNGSTKERRRVNPNLGPKPAWQKHLSRNSATYILKKHDDKEMWAQLLNATTWVSGGRGKPAIEVPDNRLRYEALRYLTDRRDGRPFVAENPAKAADSNPAANDQRLQKALREFIQPNTQPKAEPEPKTEIKSDVVM